MTLTRELRGTALSLSLHDHQGGEVSRIIGEEQRRPLALAGGALQGKVHPPKGYRGKGLPTHILRRR